MRVLLVCDQPVMVIGLRAALEGKHIEVVQATTFSAEVLAETGPVNAVILDCSIPLDCKSLANYVSLADSRLILWYHSIQDEMAVYGLRIGVKGFLDKRSSSESHARAVLSVMDGQMWCDSAITNTITESRKRSVNLTKQESKLVALVTVGMKNKEIATALLISEGTVKVYLSRLFQKCHVSSRHDLAVLGIRNGLSPHRSEEPLVQRSSLVLEENRAA